MVGVFASFVWAGSAQGAVLYDQIDNFSAGQGAFSDAYPASPFEDTRYADDFVVPSGQTWNITEVDVAGFYTSSGPQAKSATPRNAPPTTNVNVFIYADNGGLPAAAPLFQQLNVPTSGAPNYLIPLTGVPGLAAGHYWVSVQQTGATFGEGPTDAWLWQLRSVVSNSSNGAAKQNGNCPTQPWDTRSNCDVSGTNDLAFRLLGTLPQCPTVTLGANKFHPARPVAPFVKGVRARLRVSQPSLLQVDATIAWGNGQVTDLGRHYLKDPSVRRLRLALPDAIKDKLPYFTKVKLSLKIVAFPFGAPNCVSAAISKTFDTKVVHVSSKNLN